MRQRGPSAVISRLGPAGAGGPVKIKNEEMHDSADGKPKPTVFYPARRPRCPLAAPGHERGLRLRIDVDSACSGDAADERAVGQRRTSRR